MRPIVSALALALAIPTALHGQTPVNPPPPPQIVTTAVGEATATPDRAIVHFMVETRASTAAAAGSANATTQQAVINALKGRGTQTEKITTSGYSVSPDERYDNGQRRVIGYIARNAVVVDVTDINTLGPLIDAALGAGSNAVGGVRLYSSRHEEVRRSALESAVTRARQDAEVMARAAGGSLGGLLELATTDAGGPRPVASFAARAGMEAAMVADTPIAVGEQKVAVSVTAKWAFVASPR